MHTQNNKKGLFFYLYYKFFILTRFKPDAYQAKQSLVFVVGIVSIEKRVHNLYSNFMYEWKR